MVLLPPAQIDWFDARDVHRRNSARGLTIGALAAQLLIYVKQLKDTRRKTGNSMTAEQAHFSEILISLRFVANSSPGLGSLQGDLYALLIPQLNAPEAANEGAAATDGAVGAGEIADLPDA